MRVVTITEVYASGCWRRALATRRGWYSQLSASGRRGKVHHKPGKYGGELIPVQCNRGSRRYTISQQQQWAREA